MTDKRSVDEGLLHAYLAGELSPERAELVDQLVAESDEWMVALSEARQLAAHAQKILDRLGDVDLDVAAPPRKSSPARPSAATAPAPAQAAGSPRWLPVALLLSLLGGGAAGWFGRDMVGGGVAPSVAVPGTASPAAGDPPPAVNADSAAGSMTATVADSSATQPTATEAPPPSLIPEPAQRDTVPADPLPADSAPQRAELAEPAMPDSGVTRDSLGGDTSLPARVAPAVAPLQLDSLDLSVPDSLPRDSSEGER